MWRIENFIKVDEMLRQPWTCMGLEWLTCRIVEFDQLTPEEEETTARVMAPEYSTELSEEETGVVEKFTRCRAQHHGVYDRLTSLTPQAFGSRLESVLGRLGALKNLEMFGFEYINHKIGKAELDWMAKSWPKLNLMYGLDQEGLYMFEHAQDRAALIKYFTKLRSDVAHDSFQR
ncbi:hypothetical protein BGZ47_006903 [Haplosporangium gracile]|nr:hypothetical protein BGZ47_006903 [Haplosporangium gracile]